MASVTPTSERCRISAIRSCSPPPAFTRSYTSGACCTFIDLPCAQATRETVLQHLTVAAERARFAGHEARSAQFRRGTRAARMRRSSHGSAHAAGGGSPVRIFWAAAGAACSDRCLLLHRSGAAAAAAASEPTLTAEQEVEQRQQAERRRGGGLDWAFCSGALPAESHVTACSYPRGAWLAGGRLSE